MLLFKPELKETMSKSALAEKGIAEKWNEVQSLYTQVINGAWHGKDLRMLPVKKTGAALDDLHDYVSILMIHEILKKESLDSWNDFADALVTLRINIADIEKLLNTSSSQ